MIQHEASLNNNVLKSNNINNIFKMSKKMKYINNILQLKIQTTKVIKNLKHQFFALEKKINENISNFNNSFKSFLQSYVFQQSQTVTRNTKTNKTFD